MSKTRVNRTLPSVKDLFLQHSAAHVHTVSYKRYITGHNQLTGLPQFSRPMTDADAVQAQARKFQ